MGQTRGLRSTILATAAAVSLFACHPVGIDDASETDMVVTRKATDYDYSSNRTYDMADTITDLCGYDASELPNPDGAAGARPSSDLDCNELNHNFDTQVLAEIRRNFEALGYVPVEAGKTADVALLVGAVSSNNWVAYTYYPWWFYPYYPYYGGGIYYPYYPTTSVVNYPTGSLIMDLVSLKDTDDKRTPSIWTGAISGLLAQGDTSAAARINTTIDQAFAQSPYLKVGNQ